MTVNLSKGALAMSRKRVIVKRLNSIQNFGAMDVLCTDKTGTLTLDWIILEKHVHHCVNADALSRLLSEWQNLLSAAPGCGAAEAAQSCSELSAEAHWIFLCWGTAPDNAL